MTATARADTVPALRVTLMGASPLWDGEGGSDRFTLEPSIRMESDTLALRAAVRLRSMHGNGATSATQTRLRELSLAYREAEFSARIGAQQVNWGRMDFIRITDVVNPVDTADLYYEEMPEAKKPLWMANLEWTLAAGELQLLLVPQAAIDTLPARMGGLGVHIDRPPSRAASLTYAARYGFEYASWNVDLVAYRGWDAAPALRLQSSGPTPSLVGSARRMSKLGFSLDRPLGGTVLRVEGAYSPSQAAPGQAIPDGGPGRHWSLGAGLDVRFKEWFVAGQVIGDRYGGGFDGGNKSDNVALSLLVQRKWMQDRLAVRLLRLTELEQHSSWSSLQSILDIGANQELWIQADRFRGAPGAAFGQLAPRSRVAFGYRLRL